MSDTSDSTSGKAARGPRGDDGADKRTSPTTFYRQVVAELRKVVYPTQEQLITYFLVVMVFVVVMMALIATLDLAFGRLAFAVFTGPDQQ
ncbi:preprotein translocase subunit SecE [Nocardioides dongkuii]|uniref:preprotein translocase subunit SecE n=1 Tax=Nocardioides dongkuii TaxID=2760089 RepID=UPI001C706F94|nr:preprotein translocase subunit SecE [Nocardioides dongkuii]